MNRREFVRILGSTTIVTAIAPNYVMAKGSYATNGFLLEACSFSEKGGWALDTQFYHQMGGNYLLAHGMGEVVADASTTFEIPDGGDYFVYVRTKNWVPGNWKAPGRFKVGINGEDLTGEFGTQPDWNWQDGGRIRLRAGKNKVVLKDLTGFDGRVDAIYFSPFKNPDLPLKTADVIGWKDEVSGRSKKKVKSEKFDLVIVGGGLAGCAAALAADKEGLKVALIQDRPVFGGNASKEFSIATLGIMGKGSHILSKINNLWGFGDDIALNQAKREDTMSGSGVHLYPNMMAIGIEKSGDKIVSVDARNTESGIIKRFVAPLFVDCSGDGWLGYFAGAEYRYGRESYKEFDEQWVAKGEKWSPATADNQVMGATVIFRSEKEVDACSFPEVPWAMDVAKDKEGLKSTWRWEYSKNELNQVDDFEEIRDHLFRAIYGSFYNAKQKNENANKKLARMTFIAGKRESRRIVGNYIYTMKDMTEHRTFFDTVAEEKRAIDVHYPQIKYGGPNSDYDFKSEACFYELDELYYLPFRSLCSKDIPNLMMAGRCFSCSHVGLGGPRVMLTGGQMGIATGYAASLCKANGKMPKEVGVDHIDELRKLIGYES